MPWRRANLRWATLLLAGVAHGCLFGGQTGSDRGLANCNPGLEYVIAFDQPSATGESAQGLLDRVGSERRATVTHASAEFWSAVGVEPAPSVPLPFTLHLAYSGGAIRTDRCEPALSVEVDVWIDAGDGVLTRAGTGTLTSFGAENYVRLVAGFAGEGGSAPLTLEATLSGGSTNGSLNAGPGRGSASFSSP